MSDPAPTADELIGEERPRKTTDPLSSINWTLPAVTQYDRIVGKFGGTERFIKFLRGRCARQTLWEMKKAGVLHRDIFPIIQELAKKTGTIISKEDWLPDVRPGATMTWHPDGWIDGVEEGAKLENVTPAEALKRRVKGRIGK